MNAKFLIRKNTFQEGKVSYSAVITAKNENGEKVATAYLPVNFKKDSIPTENYKSFLIETDNFFLSAYPVELPDGKKGGKPKLIICNYTITKDYSDNQYNNTEQPVDLQPIDDDTLPF